MENMLGFNDMNKAASEEYFPLSCIDHLLDNAFGNQLLSLMYAFSEYSLSQMQILMAEKDKREDRLCQKGHDMPLPCHAIQAEE